MAKIIPSSKMDIKIAKAILQAADIRESNFDSVAASKALLGSQEQIQKTGRPNLVDYSRFYSKDLTFCIQEACAENDVPISLVTLIEFGFMTSWNDMIIWAEKYSNIV